MSPVKRRACLLLLSIPLIASTVVGCSDQRVIEKLGFVRTIAYESGGEGNEGKIKVTISIPKTNNTEAIHYTAVSVTAREARILFDRQNERHIVNGQLRQVLFGETLAQEGLWPHIDSLLRDPTIGNRAHVLVVEGSAEQLLKRNYLQSGTAGEYIDNLIRIEKSSLDVADTSIHTFLRDYYDDGIEPVASIIKDNSYSILFNGIALFRQDKMVGKVSAEDLPYFGALHGRVKSGDLFTDFKGKQYASDYSSMIFFSSKRKVKVLSIPSESGGRAPKVVVKLNIIGSLLEYNGPMHVSDREEQVKLEAEIAKYVKERCETLIRQLQDARSDAIGIGQHVRNAMPYAAWKKLDWPETFSRAEIGVEVRVRIRNFGKMQ
ncbi:Ger(x)C family spore germination protein [Cohnella sp. AR92]|uniref:Ger(x)C family spore germination protein n=1 Tax=Cohnella sp. AR92 TaxID=648716 RepID=UPI000F8F3938|nr:Ger(x)C family spore germination protein [Cohnella sp. AR92]RUS44623.1 Ger(x)C family spore germination protein [Cohnella sp. AR92]